MTPGLPLRPGSPAPEPSREVGSRGGRSPLRLPGAGLKGRAASRIWQQAEVGARSLPSLWKPGVRGSGKGMWVRWPMWFSGGTTPPGWLLRDRIRPWPTETPRPTAVSGPEGTYRTPGICGAGGMPACVLGTGWRPACPVMLSFPRLGTGLTLVHQAGWASCHMAGPQRQKLALFPSPSCLELSEQSEWKVQGIVMSLKEDKARAWQEPHRAWPGMGEGVTRSVPVCPRPSLTPSQSVLYPSLTPSHSVPYPV